VLNNLAASDAGVVVLGVFAFRFGRPQRRFSGICENRVELFDRSKQQLLALVGPIPEGSSGTCRGWRSYAAVAPSI
jgi:hypothetical protein